MSGAKILYLSGQRKRKRVGTVREVMDVAGVKAYRIKKVWNTSWIPEKDVVNGMDTKTEETPGAVGDDGGRAEAANENGSETDQEGLARKIKETIQAAIAEANSGTVQSESQTGTGIREDSTPVATREDLRVRGDQSGGEFDMFPHIASSARRASPQGKRRPADLRNEPIPAGLPGSPHMDRIQSGNGVSNGAVAGRLERNRPDKATIDKLKKQIYRGARSGKRKLSEFAEFIGAMAERNDARFFIKLSAALQARKTKGTK